MPIRAVSGSSAHSSWPDDTRVRPRRPVGSRFFEGVAAHALAITISLVFLMPFVFAFLTAVMTDSQALTSDLWPRVWQWSNFTTVLKTPGYLTWVRNSLFYAVGGTFLMMVSSLPPAFAMARMRFRGRRLALIVVVTTMMLPPQVIVIPMYLVWSQQLGLTGTLWPLIIPLAFGDAFSIFLLRQFLLTIPREYIEQAQVDGCSLFGAMVRVVVPMAKPGLLTVGLFQFFWCWNDFFGPQIYASENPAAWTLAYGLETFKSAHHANWNLTMAATILVMAPVVLLFFFAQKAFIEGITLTGVKG